MTDRVKQLFKPDFRFGLGGVSLGNECNKHTDKDAEATLEAAWAVGVRYFDLRYFVHISLVHRNHPAAKLAISSILPLEQQSPDGIRFQLVSFLLCAEADFAIAHHKDKGLPQGNQISCWDARG